MLKKTIIGKRKRRSQDVETKKITEGGILSAIQIILGLILIPTGIGYSFYIEILLPITMTLIVLRCDLKIGALAGINTIGVIMLCFGNALIGIYGLQALGFGWLTGMILNKKWSIATDLLVECLVGCLFLLVLDGLTAKLVGVSLLDDEVTALVFEMAPNIDRGMIQVIYYLSIAAVPVALALISYIGSLLVGYRIGILQKTPKEKYWIIRYYKRTLPYVYQNKKVVRYLLVGVWVQRHLWPYLSHPYLKAWVACSCVIAIYFILIDEVKLIGQGILLKWQQPLLALVYHWGALLGLIYAFKWTGILMIVIGAWVEKSMHLREKQTNYLACSMAQWTGVKKAF